MIDIAQIQKARQRARARLKVNVQKPRIRVMAGVAYDDVVVAAPPADPETPPSVESAVETSAAEQRAGLQLIVDNAPLPPFASLDDADAPFDPPDVDDILGLQDEGENVTEYLIEDTAADDPPPAEEVDPEAPSAEAPEIVAEQEAYEPELAFSEAEPATPTAQANDNDAIEQLPEDLYLQADLEFEPQEELTLEAAAANDATVEEEPPFDPPELETLELKPPELAPIELLPIDPPGGAEATTLANESPPPAPLAETQAAVLSAPQIPAPPRRAFALNVDQTLYEQAVPPITIHASWDRADMGVLLENFAADRRMQRASISMERGGLDAAILWLKSNPSPDLLILDSDLRAPEILAGLARLADVIAHGAKIIFVGAVNDIGLMREMAACGIKYVVPPIREDDLARCVCGMYAEATTSRVIAVMGARGGIGASTIAHNLAWSIAERQDQLATLVDLDLPFGAAAFSARLDAPRTIADLGETPYERVALKQTSRLQLLAAPAQLAQSFDLAPEGVQALIHQARRSSAYVVLDIPHAWNASVQQALALADDVVLVAGPDLASLRNADQLIKAVAKVREGKEPPLVALSMTGVPKRPEIPLKDFKSALGIAPLASFQYDPALYGAAAIKGQMLGESAPRSKPALIIDALATAITGHEPVVRKKNVKSILRDAPEAQANDDADAPLDLAQPATDEYLIRARDAARAALESPQPAVSFGHKPRASKMRIAAYLAALLIVGGALAVRSTRDASATEPHAAPSPAHAVVAPRPVDPQALYRQAVQALAADPAAGLTALRALADHGYAPAEYRLAKMYEHGEGLAADIAQARQWTERAATAGNARAMHDLGVYYAEGEGVAQDDATAFNWFNQAANFDIADSQFNLGVIYQTGRGVEADNAEALYWFTLAARHGDQAAATKVRELESVLLPDQIAEAHARAESFSAATPDAAANYEASADSVTAAAAP